MSEPVNEDAAAVTATLQPYPGTMLSRALEAAYEAGSGAPMPVYEVVREEGSDPFLIVSTPGLAGQQASVKLQDLPNLPRGYVRGTEEVLDVPSLKAYFDVHKSASTMAYANMKDASVEIVFDDDLPGKPGRGEHKCKLLCVRSNEWNAIRSASGTWKTQEHFAEFIDEMSHVFEEPDPAMMQSVVLNLEGTNNVSWKSHIDRTSGAVQLSYTEDASAKPAGSMQFPSKGTLVARIYESSPPQQFAYKAQYRVSPEGKLSVRFVVDQFERHERDALKHVQAMVAEATGIPVLTCP